MPNKKTEAEYQEWVKEVSAKVPEEHKANFDALIGTPFGTELFEGSLRTKEFHRRMNEVHDEKTALAAQRQAFAQDVNSMDQWFQEEAPKNQRLLAERDKLRAEATAARERLAELGLEEEAPKVRSARSSDEDGLQKEIQGLKQRLAMMDQALPSMLGDLGLSLRQAQKDGFDVDPRQMIALSMEKSVPLPQAYDMLTYEKRQERDSKEREEAIAKAREEGKREALSQRGSPDYMKPAGPSILDAIAKPMSSVERIDAAVNTYLTTAR